MIGLADQIRRFIAAEHGATAIEYGLIAALVAVGMLVGLVLLGDNVRGLFEFVRDRTGAVAAAP